MATGSNPQLVAFYEEHKAHGTVIGMPIVPAVRNDDGIVIELGVPGWQRCFGCGATIEVEWS